MKKTLLLLAALGLAGVASLQAGTVDVYITGSTAFRANVYTACTKLFASAPNIYYGGTAYGGNGKLSSKDLSWVMTGTPITTLTNVYGFGNSPSSTTLNIHGLFTGSIQGLKAVETAQQLVWAKPQGTLNGTANAYSTNSATLAFSDSDNAACPYIVTGNYEQESVAVQPFVMVRAHTSLNGVTNINNVSWEQMYHAIPHGRLPLSAWTYHDSDSNNWVYLCERTRDSGTRRTFTAGEFYPYGDIGVYCYDNTNSHGWYTPAQLAPAGLAIGTGLTYGDGTNGVMSAGGYGFDGNVNLLWGNGYVAGSDVANTLNINKADNQSIGVLSVSDAASVGGSTNWGCVISLNGLWPTVGGTNLNGNVGTNDYSPITSGFYPLWGYEVVVHPINPGLISDQDITQAQLGDWLTPGTFEGVFNYQTINNGGGSTLTGSLENEIQLSKTGSPGATAIRLSDMQVGRSSVGGEIFPPLN